VFVTRLLHGEECVVTNHRIIVMSSGEFHHVLLGDVIRVSAHAEAYLPWVAWARFFPVRIYRASTERFGAELVLECTSREDMQALATAIERSALLTEGQARADGRAGAQTPQGYDSDRPTPQGLTNAVEATAYVALSRVRA
jgi:hypothetical protein